MIAIAAVTCCTIMAAVVNQRGAKKIKQMELLFHEKVKAFYEFLLISDKLTNMDDPMQLTEFSRVSTNVFLLASSQTQSLIAEYTEAIYFALQLKKEKHPDLLEASRTVGVIKNRLVNAMQKDLKD